VVEQRGPVVEQRAKRADRRDPVVEQRAKRADRRDSVRAPGDVLVHLRRARDHIDRAYAEALDLEAIAATAGLSKWHFHRLFTATYGITPAAYLSQRRVERAQDLLRATNLSVTEVCHAVGYSSLGSFSSRFRDIVGESPREFQQRWGADAPRIPGCVVFMWGLAERKPTSEEKRPG
jgi:AraC-like DNA-binding protein